MAKSVLLIARQAPWSGPGAREMLGIALAGGAFELPVALLFLDDSVLQLHAQQQPAQLEQKDLTANLQALPLFGVDELYACSHSLHSRGLNTEALNLPVQALAAHDISALIERHDLVITL